MMIVGDAKLEVAGAAKKGELQKCEGGGGGLIWEGGGVVGAGVALHDGYTSQHSTY